MNTKQRNQMYPKESFNTMLRCEQRWEDDANIYGDISSDWQISLGNGKRLNRKWKRCGGLAIVQDPWSGQDRSIYNENFDVDWQKAKYNTSLQPDDDPDFYYAESFHPQY
tara:strand:- start:129 stop:458 length:330 start_codon:yes stop_codon:yes gene_type:complete